MKLTNEFTVAVPIERAWETLLDIERVAGFLPGATIEPTDEEGVYAGAMKVKLGPMTVQYKGTARMGAVDEANHTADIQVEAKELRGQGTARATIRNTLVPEDGGTRVVAETDLDITGRQAQFGRGIMQDVAGRMLGQFAQRFEAHLLGDEGAEATPAGAGAAAAAPAAGPAAGATEPAAPPSEGPPGPDAGDGAPRAAAPAPSAEDALDLGAVLGGVVSPQRAAIAAGALVGAAVLLRALGGRRRSVTFHFSRSW
jgi:carbon monoxide dehydrogenase subunit G